MKSQAQKIPPVRERSHYDWLFDNLNTLGANLGIEGVVADGSGRDLRGLISAHGDKCRQYRSRFEAAGIHWFHGAALYLLSYIEPWCKEVRETKDGWIDVCDWIIGQKDRFIDKLPAAE